MRAAIQRFWCRLLRHRHGQAYILCTTTDGVALKSHEMDYWSAEWIVVNNIMPGAKFAGRDIVSCRIVTL